MGKLIFVFIFGKHVENSTDGVCAFFQLCLFWHPKLTVKIMLRKNDERTHFKNLMGFVPEVRFVNAVFAGVSVKFLPAVRISLETMRFTI